MSRDRFCLGLLNITIVALLACVLPSSAQAAPCRYFDGTSCLGDELFEPDRFLTPGQKAVGFTAVPYVEFIAGGLSFLVPVVVADIYPPPGLPPIPGFNYGPTVSNITYGCFAQEVHDGCNNFNGKDSEGPAVIVLAAVPGDPFSQIRACSGGPCLTTLPVLTPPTPPDRSNTKREILDLLRTLGERAAVGSIALTGFSAYVLPTLVLDPPVAAFMATVQSLALAGGASLAEIGAIAGVLKEVFPDPPLSLPVTFPSITPQGSVTPKLAAALQDLVSRELLLALEVQMLRDAANDFGDALKRTTPPGTTGLDGIIQRVAIQANFVRSLAEEQSRLWATLPGLFKEAGVANITFTEADLAAFHSLLVGSGLPQTEVAILKQLGLSPEAIDALTASLLSLDTTGVPRDLFSLFAMQGAVDSELAEAATIASTPEPTTLLLWGTTMAGLGLAARWRRRRSK